MKKISFALAGMLLIASSCNKQAAVKQPTGQIPAQNQSAPEQNTGDVFFVELKDIVINSIITDQQVIKRNKKDGTSELVISSVKTVLPELKIPSGVILTIFSQPQNSQYVFLKSILYGSDAPAGSYYSFNLLNNQLIKMKINSLVGEKNWDTSGRLGLSEDKTKFFFVPYSKTKNGDENLMYLVNLETDSYKELVKLAEGETFNAGFYSNGGCWLDCPSYFEIKWADADIVRYVVYLQRKKPKNLNAADAFDFVYSKNYQNSILAGNREIRTN